MHSSQEIAQTYIESIDELNTLVTFAHAISNQLMGKKLDNEAAYYASVIFTKIAAQGITLTRIIPKGLHTTNNSNVELWDISSICCITRSILEAHDTLAYIAVHPNTENIRNFRIKVWVLHDLERRLKLLNFINSNSPELAEITHSANRLRAEILKPSNSKLLHSSQLKKIETENTPDFLIPAKTRCEASKINYKYYLGAKNFLSAYVHTHPFAIHQLMDFKADSSESLDLISLIIRYSIVFLAKAIDGMLITFPSDTLKPPSEVKRIIELWSSIAQEGVSFSKTTTNK